MIDSAHEETAHPQAEARESGAQTRAVRRRAQESVGGREKITQEMTTAGVQVLLEMGDEIDTGLVARKVFTAMNKARSHAKT
jgi:hypothetical protein